MQRKLRPLAVAAELATGYRPPISTAMRWASKGVHGIRLRTWMVGGRRMTTVDAVRQFNAAVTAARRRDASAPRGNAATENRAGSD